MPCLVLLLVVARVWGEDFEEITLADGRTLIGRYSEAEHKVYLRSEKEGKIRVAIAVAASDIVARKPWFDAAEMARRQAEADALKRKREEEDAARTAAARKAVQDTIDAQNQRERERAARQAEQELREAAAARAEYWRGNGYEFDPGTMSASQMDEEVRRRQERAERMQQQKERQAAEAALAAQRRKDEERRSQHQQLVNQAGV